MDGATMLVWVGLGGWLTSTGGVYRDPSLLPAPTDFYTVTPCRLADTRTDAGGVLAGGSTRTITVAGGTCLVPASAVAVSVNLTAVEAAVDGNLVVAPGNSVIVPTASSVNFTAGVTRANNAVVLLATDGTGTVQVKNRSSGAVHFVLDVNGYFQ